MIESILARPEVGRLGWALVHFVWQGAAAAFVLALILFALRKRSAAARYLAATTTFFMMAILPLATLILMPAAPAKTPNARVVGRVFDPTPVTASIESRAPHKSVSTDATIPSPSTHSTATKTSQIPPIPLVSNSPTAHATLRLSDRLEPFLPWLVAGWVLGVACLSLRLLGGLWRVRRLTRRATKPVAQALRERFESLARRLRISRPVRLLESALAAVPMTVGWLKPVVLMPASFMSGLAPEQIEALIAHELAHIRRHDYLVNLIQTAIETLLFYHPAIWWVSRRMRVEREFACDDLAARACGDSVVYARALVEMETLRAAPPQPALSAASGPLFARVARLLGRPETAGRAPFWLAGAITLALMAIAFCGLNLDLAGAAQKTTSPVDPNLSWGEGREGVRLGAVAARAEQPFAAIIHKWEWIEGNGNHGPGQTGHGFHKPGLGAPVAIRYRIENNGKRPIFYYGAPSAALITQEVWWGGSIKVIGPDGRQLPLRRAVDSSGNPITIARGNTHDGVVRLTDYFDFATTGTYRVSLFLQMHYKTLFGGDKIIGVASGEFPLTLTGGTVKPQAEPYVVEGIVTDADGKPIAGATVRADAGKGTLLPTGSAVTGPDGRYSLTCGPGYVSRDSNTVPLQDLRISAEKGGFYEKDVNVHGHLFIAGDTPNEEALRGNHASLDKVVLPNQRRRVDFVLLPAVQVSGTLTKTDGKSMPNWIFAMMADHGIGTRQTSVKTDAAGRFTIKDMRPDVYNVVMAQGASARLELLKSGDYRIGLIFKDPLFGKASLTTRIDSAPPDLPAAALSPEVMKNLDALTTGSRGLREHAAYVLGEIGSGTMVPRLFEMLRDGDVETRRAAARAFSYSNGVILDDIFVVHMREMLGRDFPPDMDKKPTKGVRFGAAMNSSNENAREAARKCFESSRRELRFSPVVRGLIEALGDPDPQVRKTIKNTLEQNYSDGMRYGEDREMWRAWFAKNDPQWGDPVDGVMARLRTLDPELGAPGRVMGETGRIRNDENPPSVFLDLRKDGRPNYSLYAPQEDFELDVDGNKFHLAVPLAAEWRTLTGGAQLNGLRIELGREWKGAGGPLHWTPGMHQVRLSVKLHPPLSDPSRPIEVVSNPVAIQILSAGGAQRTVDNLKYEAGFVPDQSVALLGEEVMISFFVRNTGDVPIYLSIGGDGRGIRPLRFNISAVDSNGNAVRDPYPNAKQMNWGGPGGRPAIQPGLAHNERLPISKWCAFENPGVYTVTCRTTPDINKTDSMLGWGARQSNASRHTVSTSFTLTLKEPSTAETRRVIATRRAEADKERYQSNAGMSTLRAPLFLEPLLEKGRAGDVESIKAIGGIETPKATQALIGLAQEKIKAGRLDLALAALDEVVRRLPNPRYYDEEKDYKTGKTTGKMNTWSETDRQRVARTWRPEMAGPVREIARRLVNYTDQKSLDLAGRILGYIGTADDMPAALAGYTRAIESTQALPYKPEFYLQSSAAYVYAFTIGELLKRGGKIPDRPATLGESAAYLVALSADKSFQPADRRQQIQRLIAADVPFMNFLMLQQLNDPVPEALAAKVPEFMRSKYKDVQKAAIEFARRHPRAEYKQPLADALKTLDDSFMLMVANGAAPANAIPTIELVDIWFGRIAPTDSGREALRYLIESVTDGGMVNSATILNAEETAAVKERWGRFIRENRARLSQGKRFKPGDPEFTPDLLPPGFKMAFGQTPWPPKS